MTPKYQSVLKKIILKSIVIVGWGNSWGFSPPLENNSPPLHT
jgi:hypothetical protein